MIAAAPVITTPREFRLAQRAALAASKAVATAPRPAPDLPPPEMSPRTRRVLDRQAAHRARAADPATDPGEPRPPRVQDRGLVRLDVDALPLDVAIKRFKRQTEPIIREVRQRSHYLKPSARRKMKSRRARLRAAKTAARARETT